MGHELDITDGVASVASARLDMWHRLGTVLPDLMTAEQALEAAHLARWNVRKKALWLQGDPVLTEDGVTSRAIKVPDQFATVRTNPIDQQENVLGVVGQQYTVIQNEEHAELLNTLVDESGAHFETAGALFGGRQTFISMKLPRKIELRGANGTDVTELYLIARNSHDGTSAFQLLISPVRPVCMNTVRAAIREAKSSWSIRHTRNALENIEIARQALGMTWRYVDTLEVQMQRMIEQEISRSEATNALRKVFKFDQEPGTVSTATEKNQNERIDSVVKLWVSSPTNVGFGGSAYGLYNAVTEWADHFSPVTGKGDADVKRAERLAKGGEMDRIKAETFQLLSV